jgi:hypothetical protein
MTEPNAPGRGIDQRKRERQIAAGGGRRTVSMHEIEHREA